MYEKIFFLLLLTKSLAFLPVYKNLIKIPLFNNKNNDDLEKIKILDIDFNKIIQDFDNYAIQQNNNLPKIPENEDEIEDDSFEGYLKSEFYKIADINVKNEKNIVVINFETFYEWRTNIGTVLYDYEIENIYYTITNNYYCNLMEFILINKIIDENDGAEF